MDDYFAHKSDYLIEFTFPCNWRLWYLGDDRSIEIFRYFTDVIYFIYNYDDIISYSLFWISEFLRHRKMNRHDKYKFGSVFDV